ncbi:tripartite tricarboxylate transporter TctB family protein [Aeromonas sobria]|uniref:tripartite tricarboxylate transporter TctB family protein n=1 Tax=Aeromonas sobria TaxID=646 RepID=UPI0026EF7979|nr:tripartite tricarboxylate transporter TctB family protein [Aeromonas sobria]
MSDRIFAAIWLLLCLAGAAIAWQIQSEYSYEPLGPRPFPLGIIGLMALCALLLLRRQPDSVSWPPLHTLRHLAIMVVALAGYGASFEWLGFPLATTLLTFVLGRLFGASAKAALLSGVVGGLVLYLAFDRLLDVTLPLGVWFS